MNNIVDISSNYKLQIAIFILIMGFALYVFWSFQNRIQEDFYADTADDIRNQYSSDEVLRNLYRNVHNLEAIDRIEINQNNGAGGGNHNVNQQQYISEQLYKENSRLQNLARQDIARRRDPMTPQNLPPIGNSFDDCHLGDCQINMDYNERILGIPSVPGTIHSYYNE
jgi:hypothetical protein